MPRAELRFLLRYPDMPEPPSHQLQLHGMLRSTVAPAITAQPTTTSGTATACGAAIAVAPIPLSIPCSAALRLAIYALATAISAPSFADAACALTAAPLTDASLHPANSTARTLPATAF